jgi:hypothetical protein
VPFEEQQWHQGRQTSLGSYTTPRQWRGDTRA